MAAHLECSGQNKNAYRIMVGRASRTDQLRRRKSRWENNIKMDLRETVWMVKDSVHLGQNRGK